MTPYYDADGVTIYHGDCRDVLPGLTADAVVSDPPYGINYQHGTRKDGAKLGQDGQSIAGDNEPFDPAHLLVGGTRAMLWGANHYADKLPASRGWLVWDKRDGVESNDQSDCEFAWTNFLSVGRLFSCLWNGGVRTGREQREGRFHVNQKPVGLMHWCLGLLGPVGVVVDPYMGSGSTLVAAVEQGQRAIGIEVDERYCEIAARRLAQGVLFGASSS